MKKIIATLMLVNTFFVLQAQKLETKIPSNADVVISANAENLFKLIDISDIDKNELGLKILKGLNNKREDKIASIGNLGIDIESSSYYFFKKTDSISYHTVLIELKDRKTFESTLKPKKFKKIVRERGCNYIEGYSELTIWNDEFLIVINGKKSYDFFRKHKDRLEKLKEEGEEGYVFKKRIVKSWLKSMAFNILEKDNSNSIATNKSFQEGKRKNSSATLWVRDYGMLMSNFIGSLGRNVYSSMSYLMPQKGKNIYGIEGVTANLFFDKNKASILLDMSVSKSLEKSFKKIYNKRMNSTLINSFDHDKALAFWSVSINTEELLIQYPEMIDEMYGGMLPKYKEEIDIVGDVFSLILDEEAIAKLLTGDALFVLNDFKEKEVAYTSYKYDENHKREKVTKTKKILAPDFTLMIGSEEKELLNKVFKLGEKYKVVSATNNVFELDKKIGKLPFNLYVVVKKNVLYITTSKERAVKIEAGNINYKGRKHSKLIKKNSSVVYFDVKTLDNNMFKEFFGRDERRMANFSNENINDLYFKVSRIKRGKMSSELRLNTKGKEENTLKLLFKLINNIAK